MVELKMNKQTKKIIQPAEGTASYEETKENNFPKGYFIGFVLLLVFLASIFCLLFVQIFNIPKLEAKYKKALSVEEKIESDILNLESKMHIVKISDYETDIYGNDEQIELYNSLQVARQKAIEKRREAENDLFYAEGIINRLKGYKLYKKYTELGSGEDK